MSLLCRNVGPAPPLTPSLCQGISQAAGSGKTGTGATGRLPLALSVPRTSSGTALASWYCPAGKGPSLGGPELAHPLVPLHLGPPDHGITTAFPATPQARPQDFIYLPTPHIFPTISSPRDCRGTSCLGWSRRWGRAALLPTPSSQPWLSCHSHTSQLGPQAPPAPPPDLPLARSFLRSRPIK